MPLPSVLLSLAAFAAVPFTAYAQAEAPPTSASTVESDSELFARARALAASGDHPGAVRMYDELLARDPHNADARLARGRVYAWMRQWGPAEADLTAVTAASPGYADGWSALGDLYLWSGRPTQAVEAYSRWQALQPQDPAPLLARARAQRAAGNQDAARVDSDAALALGADPSAASGTSVASGAPRVSNPEAVAPAGYRWTAQAEVGRTDFSGDRASWNDRGLTLRRHLAQGSVALELLQTERFGIDDHAWAVDAYVDAWARAYANLRYQHAPDGALYPDHAWRAELFQGVGTGWELSASVDQLHFSPYTTTLYGVGAGRYVGPFYLRARARRTTSSGTGFTGQVRYYYVGNGSDYLEVSAGNGRGEEERFGTVVDTESSSVGVAFVRYVTSNVGLKVTASHADGRPHETKVAATVYYRW